MHPFINKFIALTSFCFLIVNLCFSAGEFKTIGAQQAALGINGISIVNAYSANNNQAAMAFLENPTVGLYYTNQYLVSGLNNMAASASYPFKHGAFGVTINYGGYSAYNETKIGISYARKLADFISIGGQVDFLNTKIEGYGSKFITTFELSVYTKPIKELTIAAHIYNPLKITIDDFSGEKIATTLRIGAAYNIMEKANVSVEVKKDIREDFQFKVGIDYQVIDILSIRAGVTTDPIMGTFGFGLKIKENLRIDLASSYHQRLGFSPHIGISYELDKK